MNVRAIVVAGVLLTGGVVTVVLTMRAPTDDRSAPAAEGDTSAASAAVHEFWETYRQATTLRVAGRLAEARDAYRRALALNADHEDALYQLGNVSLELEEYAQAESAWVRLSDVNHQSSRAHSRLGDLHACIDRGTSRDLARAESEYRRAADLNREETGPLLRLGELALMRGDLAGAMSSLNAVLGSHKHSVEAGMLAGYVEWKHGRREAALVRFREAIAPAESVRAALRRPGEGDTRQGLTPNLAQTARCRNLSEQMDMPSRIESAQMASRMTDFYRRLDRRLAELGGRSSP